MHIKGKPFLGFVLFLLVFLQGVMPFVHAHTGVSSITGIHTPEARSGFHSLKESLCFVETSKAVDESTVVTVGAARIDEKESLNLCDVHVFRVSVRPLVRPLVKSHLNVLTRFRDRLVLGFYKSETHPPPTLAPPSQAL